MKPSKTEAHWRRMVAEQERSGLSVREFAEARAVSAWSLYRWRSRLGMVGRRSRGTGARRRRRPTEEAELVAVDVVGGGSEAVPVQPVLEVEFADVRVRVPQGFDAKELTRLVSVLRESC